MNSNKHNFVVEKNHTRGFQSPLWLGPMTQILLQGLGRSGGRAFVTSQDMPAAWPSGWDSGIIILELW